MIAYIKRMSDFQTVEHANAQSYQIYPETSADDVGSVVLTSEISESYKGDWLYLAGKLYLIEEVTPEAGITTIKIAEPENAFDRETEYTGSSDSIGAFIKAALESEFKNQTDTAHAIPYLRVDNSDTTSFVSPVTDGGLYNLSEYIKTARRSGVFCSFAISGSTLDITISSRTPTTHNVVFSDGKAQLQSRTFSRAITEKVTVYSTNGTSTDFYLTPDRDISTTPPATRLSGKWVKIASDTDAALLDLAAEEFEKNTDSYKIELYSEKSFHLFDRLRLLLDNKIFEADVTAIMRSSSDNRNFYRCGNLPVTLTDKLKAQGSTSVSRSSASSPKTQWYEVGDIFQTTRTGNPRDLLGYGTWEQIKDRFLLAAGDNHAAGDLGGEETHTLTVAEMPAHSHTLTHIYCPGSGETAWSNYNQARGALEATDMIGGGNAHNNMPPFFAIFIWLRTA